MHPHPRDIFGDDQVNFGLVPFLKFRPHLGSSAWEFLDGGKPNRPFTFLPLRLRCGLRFVGLGHFLVGESGIGLDRSKVDQAREIHDVAVVVYGGVSRVDVY